MVPACNPPSSLSSAPVANCHFPLALFCTSSIHVLLARNPPSSLSSAPVANCHFPLALFCTSSIHVLLARITIQIVIHSYLKEIVTR